MSQHVLPQQFPFWIHLVAPLARIFLRPDAVRTVLVPL